MGNWKQCYLLKKGNRTTAGTDTERRTGFLLVVMAFMPGKRGDALFAKGCTLLTVCTGQKGKEQDIHA